MKKRILGGAIKKAKRTNEIYSDSGSDIDIKVKKPRKQKQRDSIKDQARKKKAPKADISKNIHFVKTTNKLIGEIEDKGLYGSDDELLNDGFGDAGREMHLDQDLRG